MKYILLLLCLAFAGNPVSMLKDKHQHKTLESLKDLGGERCSFYSLDYTADYRLQDFIDADLNSQAAVSGAVMKMLLQTPQTPVRAAEFAPACSAFQAVTPEGDVIYARNFDYRFVDGSTIMMRTTPRRCKVPGAPGRRGYRSLSMVSMSFLGLDGKRLKDGNTDLSTLVAAPLMQMDGMNEKGLALSVLCVMYDACAQQYDTTKHTVMTSVMMRMLLDRAANVDEALAMLDDYNFFADGLQLDRKKGDFSNYHFLLSDVTGKSVVLEYVLRDGPGTDSPWVMNVLDLNASTNYFQTPGWEKFGGGKDRYDRIVKKLDENGGVLDEDEAMKLLQAVHQDPGRRSPSKTQWSVVYNLKRGTAKVCIDRDYEHTYEFSLRRFK